MMLSQCKHKCSKSINSEGGEKMNLQKKIILILLSLFLLFGCVTARPIDPRVTIIDSFLGSDISISNVSSVFNSGDLLEIQVIGVNQTAYYKKLQYKIEWLDQNGFAIPTILSRWTEFPAFENTEFRFKAVAPKPTATDFRILIRKGD